MKKAIIFIVVLSVPVGVNAHDFWMGSDKWTVYLCGGHNFPQCEFLPSPQIEVLVYGAEKLDQPISMERKGNKIEGKLPEGENGAFKLLRKKKVVYCGLLLQKEGAGKVKLSELCGVNGDMEFKVNKDSVSITIPEYQVPVLVKREGKKDIYVYPERGNVSVRLGDEKDVLFIFTLSGDIPLSVHVDVK